MRLTGDLQGLVNGAQAKSDSKQAPQATPVYFVPGIVTEVDELRKPCSKVKLSDGLSVARELFAMLERNNKRAYKPQNFWKAKSGQVPLRAGVGLAAPQIGIHKKVAVIDMPGHQFAMLNPRIIRWSETLFPCVEGCLSMPGEDFETYRFAWVEVECLNWTGPRVFGCADARLSEKDSLLNVCVQHEIAHLFGKLPPDFETEQYPTPDAWDTWSA